jgi:hypothetical protein
MKKAIKIDVELKKVYEIELGDDYREIYNAIGNGCELFCVPISFENGDSLFSDDEILLRENDVKGAFMMPDWSYPIYNNAIILGTDDEGNSVDYKSNIDEIAKNVWFARSLTLRNK